MKIKLFIIIAILFFSVLPASAAELNYFEFGPDISKALSVVSSNTPYQLFKPHDDYLSGFDIWIENEGSSGSATFELRDIDNNILASKPVSIPYIAKTWGGQKFHVKFNNSVQLVSNATYKIRMSSIMPKLKIYYADLIQLRQHNADYVLDKRIGSAYLGSAEQGFIFKFALYEEGDILAPFISNVNISVFQDKAAIRFNANEPVDYKIIYTPEGLSQQNTDYQNNYFDCQEDINTCSIEISVLADKTYNYQLFVKDVWDNESSFSGNFISLPGWTPPPVSSTSTPPIPTTDTVSPLIYDIRIVSLTDKAVKISWKTDEVANSSMLIGLDQLGSKVITSVGDSTYEFDHLLNSFDALTPNVQYYASIASIDPSGNFSSTMITFNTLAQSQTNPPLPPPIPLVPPPIPAVLPPENPLPEPEQNSTSSLINQGIQNLNQNNLIDLINTNISGGAGEQALNVFWMAPSSGEPEGGYRIDIFDEQRRLKSRTFIYSGIHEAKIKELSAGEYSVIVYADNNGVFEKVAKPKEIIVPKAEAQSYFQLAGSFIKNKKIYLMSILAIFILAAISLYFFRKKQHDNS